MSFLLAHAGHWLSALVYAAPVVIVALLFLAAWLRERRGGAGGPLPAERDELSR